ncbi:MAG: ParB N-terminal domain-containing protein [Hyphomonadaceae bacterium]|nr:ParB N-terminal domain-containing protein [Hyphomonadaceae bacterium]
MTSDTQKFQNIPLNKLIASPRNVRRKDRKADIDALAASIASCGLLQNLCVVAGEGDRFEVDAGGRRLMALKKLAKDGVIAKDFPVPCHVVASEDGREVSLIENIHRVAMDAMDEVDAFAALVAEGATPDDIARRFGATQRHVEQRLALAAPRQSSRPRGSAAISISMPRAPSALWRITRVRRPFSGPWANRLRTPAPCGRALWKDGCAAVIAFRSSLGSKPTRSQAARCCAICSTPTPSSSTILP